MAERQSPVPGHLDLQVALKPPSGQFVVVLLDIGG